MKEQKIGSEQILVFIETLADQYDWAMAPIREDLDRNISFIKRILAQPEISAPDLVTAREELQAIHDEHIRLDRQIAPILAQQRREFHSLIPDLDAGEDSK